MSGEPSRPPLRRAPGEGLVRDERGAIMVVGLFMAIGLIGALWFLIGLGNALVAREQSQEAADAVAFSNAAIEAQGMNLVASLNLIMMGLTWVYLVVRYVEDFIWKIHKYIFGETGWTLNHCAERDVITLFAGVESCKITEKLKDAHDKIKDVRTKYAKVLEPALRGLSRSEDVIVLGTPPLGVLSGVLAGAEYDRVGLSVSAGLLREKVGEDATNQVFSGLPFDRQPGNYLCKRGGKKIFNLMFQEPGVVFFAVPPQGVPWMQTFLNVTWPDIHFPKPLPQLPWAGGTMMAYLQKRFVEYTDDLCDEKFWDQKDHGPHILAKSPHGNAMENAANGTDVMQIWSFVPTKPSDSSLHIVKLPSVSNTPKSTWSKEKGSEQVTYLAQSEFFFDCDQAWAGDHCNSDDDSASFSMRWRARMRRVHAPSFRDMIAARLKTSANSIFDKAAAATKNNPKIAQANQKLTDIGSPLTPNGVIADLFGAAKEETGGIIDNGLGAGSPTFSKDLIH